MTSHVFTEDQNTMEWYIDGIPVAELKRRYEAHDALVKALADVMIVDDGIAYSIALRALAAAEVRNG